MKASEERIENRIDTPYLDSTNNGQTYMVSQFVNKEEFCNIYLKAGLR